MIEINKTELYELLSKVFDEGKTSYQDLKHDYIQNIVDNLELEAQIKQRLVQLELEKKTAAYQSLPQIEVNWRSPPTTVTVNGPDYRSEHPWLERSVELGVSSRGVGNGPSIEIPVPTANVLSSPNLDWSGSGPMFPPITFGNTPPTIPASLTFRSQDLGDVF